MSAGQFLPPAERKKKKSDAFDASTYYDLFNKFDADGSGEIDAGEIREIMKELQINISEARIERMIAMVSIAGKNDEGEVNYGGFEV